MIRSKLTISFTLLNFACICLANAKIFLLIGPSGVGKTTLITALQKAHVPVEYVITCTTRQPRAHEIHGKDYFFLTEEQYKAKLQAGELLTSTLVYGNLYGIDKHYIEKKLQKNCNLATCLTADTSQQLKDILTQQVVTIFIAPPSFDELKNRLLRRNTENWTSLSTRLASVHREMELQDTFDYKIIHNNQTEAVEELKKIFLKNTHR